MNRRLIIDGNAVYEIDEDCMLQKRMDKENEEKQTGESRGNQKNGPSQNACYGKEEY